VLFSSLAVALGIPIKIKKGREDLRTHAVVLLVYPRFLTPLGRSLGPMLQPLVSHSPVWRVHLLPDRSTHDKCMLMFFTFGGTARLPSWLGVPLCREGEAVASALPPGSLATAHIGPAECMRAVERLACTMQVVSFL
jgi:hypothetical protein